MIDEATAQRFWSYVNKESRTFYLETPRWEWTGKEYDGYGRFEGMAAHRFIWIHILGRDAPEGRHVHHVCTNPLCVNPDHLQVLTAKEHFASHREISRLRKLEATRFADYFPADTAL
jgi:hypothetical protein